MIDIDFSKILFLDIETVPQKPVYEDLSDRMKKFWDRKASFLATNDETPEDLYSRAGIYSEFGKIIVIAVGYLRKKQETGYTLIIKAISNDDESKILIRFNDFLKKYFNSTEHYLCAHNGKEFDFPYIARRMLINGIKPAPILDLQGLKPWEVRHLDTMQMWKFGDYKHFTSLDLLTEIFGIDSPKQDIDGSQVADVYWKEKDLKRIEKYCKRDVLALVQVFMRLNSLSLISEQDVLIK